MPVIDFRSDTVTKPTVEMKAAMFDAPVGDDVFGDDPTINFLEKKAADLFGTETALFLCIGNNDQPTGDADSYSTRRRDYLR